MSSNNYYGMPRKLDYKGSIDSGFQEPIDPLTSSDPIMELNSHCFNRKDIVTSPLNSPVLDRRGVSSTMFGDPSLQPQLQQQILTLKQQQQLQQQMLFQQFHQQQQQLAQEHEKQLQEYHKQLMLLQKQQDYLAEQQQLEERQRIEKEIHEKNRLTQIKNKNKEEESAIASTEVKQRLQDFVLSKKHREAAARNSPPQYRHWPLDQNSPPTPGLSPPYSHTLLGKYDDDFPLRKTASEPNLKVRSALKQKVMERRITQSPILRRRDKGFPFKRKPPLSIDCGSNSDSGPNSPPSGIHPMLPNGSCTNLKEDANLHTYLMYHTMGCSNPDLYTSPSMPNISLGRPPSTGGNGHCGYSEGELRAIGAARLGLPMTSHVLPGALPAYHHHSVPGIDGEYPSPTEGSPRSSYIAAQLNAIEEARAAAVGTKPSSLIGHPYPHLTGMSSLDGHQARIHRHRPLGRTQSAPLPIGHPFIQQNLLLQQQQRVVAPGAIEQDPEQILKDKFLVKQHIRQTVLQRTSSKSHMENVDEETEAKLAQEMKDAQEANDNDVIIKEVNIDEGALEISKKLARRESEHLLQGGTKPRHKGHHRPLARTHSSPLVTLSMPTPTQEVGPVKYRFTTALAYDPTMTKHQCTCGLDAVHPEHAGRILSIWSRLQERNLISKCEQLKSRKATLEEIQSCHSEAYTLFYATNHLSRQRLDPKHFENLPMRFCALSCGGVGVDSDTVWNDLHTSSAARMAAGCVTELAFRVGVGELKNGFALVRPPGHHAEPEQAMGFCYFNSVAIAAKQMKKKLKMKKILIVDWDVHHGNGTQQMTYDDRDILYMSIHRHDDGNFFPGTGASDECGSGDGTGFNVNIAFSGGLDPPKGDAEYLAIFRTIIMPIAREFKPDIVLVSAGFDAAVGHPPPLGGYMVSPACFGHMTRQLMSLANGKVVLVLEGGYDLLSICDSAEMCVKALLGKDIPPIAEEERCRVPCKSAIETLQKTINIQSKHWPCIMKYLATIQYSIMEAQKHDSEETDTVTALASLSMVTAKRSDMIHQETEPMYE